MGHTKSFCEIQFTLPSGKVGKNWGPELKVVDNWDESTDESKWLKDGSKEFLGSGSSRGARVRSMPGFSESHNLRADIMGMNRGIDKKDIPPNNNLLTRSINLNPEFVDNYTLTK